MDTKALLTSKTMWGILLALLTPQLAKLGFAIDDSLKEVITGQVIGVIQTGFLLFAGYGRAAAQKKISGS